MKFFPVTLLLRSSTLKPFFKDCDMLICQFDNERHETETVTKVMHIMKAGWVSMLLTKLNLGCMILTRTRRV